MKPKPALLLIKIAGLLNLCASALVAGTVAPDMVWQTNAYFLGGPVTAIQFSPDNTSVLSASYHSDSPSAAKLWRISDGALVRGFVQYEDHTGIAVFSPDGTSVFGGGGDGFMRMWNVSDGSTLWTGGTENDGFGGAAFSPDGTLIALGREDTWISVRNAASGSGVLPLFGGHYQGVTSVAFSPDGTLIASGSQDFNAILWRVSDGANLRTLYGHSSYVNAVGFSPDGQLLATGASDGTTRLWNVTNGVPVRVLNSGDTLALDFSPDGKLLLTASAGVLKFWRVADGSLVQTYDQEVEGGATSVDISPDGKLFAYGRGDGNLVVARMPLWIDSAVQASGEITLHWQGGSGLYQVQARNSLASGSWQNLGSTTTNTVFTHTCLSPIFYRVQSLPNGP